MNTKQRQQFNRMRSTLILIAREFANPEKLKRIAEREYGCGYEEALEMGYENMQASAASAVKGVRELPPDEKETR